MSEIMLANCPNCNKEIKLNKTHKVGYCLHCGKELDVESVIEASGHADIDYLNALINESDIAYKAGNYEKCIGLLNTVIVEDENNIDVWHRKAIALVNLGYHERLELKKPEDAEFSKKLAMANGDLNSVLALINSKDDCWKEKAIEHLEIG